MHEQILMLLVGIVVGAAAGVVPLAIVARMRARVARDNAMAAVNADMSVLKERCSSAEAEVTRLRLETRKFQEEYSDASKKCAGLEAQCRAHEQRIDDLKAEVTARERKLDECTSLIKQNRGEMSELQTRLGEERKQADEKLALLSGARDQLKTEFQNLANSIFDEKTKKFSEQSKTNLDLVLNPLRDQLGDFRKRIDDVYASESKDRQALSEHIKVLSALNQQVSKETDNLTKALKGESKTQGNWGEMILERALELSGLKKGVEYDTQVCSTVEDGKRQLPDVVVHLPEGRDIVVDSKVTLTAYEASINAENDQARETALAEHLESVHRHIDGLSGKSYEVNGKCKSLDFVLLFMPIESAFVAAIRREPDLFEYAYRKRIILVCPSTLLVTLRTIQNMWQSEYQSRYAQDIAKKAADLYEKFAGFIETLSEVKKSIGIAAESCEKAINQLSTGKGNLIHRIEHFKKLGIKPKKMLPADLVEAAGNTDSLLESDAAENQIAGDVRD
jgi:DNA recombination protein RmuC